MPEYQSAAGRKKAKRNLSVTAHIPVGVAAIDEHGTIAAKQAEGYSDLSLSKNLCNMNFNHKVQLLVAGRFLPQA